MNSSVSLPLWILAAGWVSRLILFVLVALSIWSVALMIDRSRVFKKADSSALEKARSLILGTQWAELQAWIKQTLQAPGILAEVAVPLRTLDAALSTPGSHSEAIDRSVRSYLGQEKTRLEKGLTPLATLGSNAPFIGLFGTVLGIIQAFGALASQNGGSASVMSGISEALVATAVGLFVAIPAVIAYNIFSRRLKVILVEAESLRDLYLSRKS